MLDFKIDLGSILDAFLRWQHGKKPDAAIIVANRFIQIFKDHGIAVSEIPRLIPMVSLKQLHNKEALISALTPEVLHFTAEFFGVQQEWLEGNSNIIYKCHYSYKNPWVFLKDAKNLKVDEDVFPVIAFCNTRNINASSKRKQSIILILREKCAQLGGKTIYRYHIHDEFGWDYPKSRIQLKAMIRVWHNQSQSTVPIYIIKSKTLEEIKEGRMVPRLCYRKSGYLEDYSLLSSESRQSKEEWEMNTVFDYIKAYRLEDVNENNVYSPQDLKAQSRFK